MELLIIFLPLIASIISGFFGKNIIKFEKKFAQFCRTKYAFTCSSGTTALHLAILMLNLKKNDEVLIPAITNMATYFSALYERCKVVPVDVLEDDLNIDPDDLKKKIENKKALHDSRGAEFFNENYQSMESNGYKEAFSNIHPIVRTNPDSKRKILYVNWTYTRQIIGMEKEESDDLLNILFKHQERLDLTCRFRWTPNTIAIWDNRSVLHYAIADYFPQRGLGHKRIMDRIAVRGEIPY